MEENRTNIPASGEEGAGSISFGGGANNEYINQFAADPHYDRTLEELEKIEQTPSQGFLDEETRERFRRQARLRRAQSEAPAGAAKASDSVLLDGKAADPGWRIGGRASYVDLLADERDQPPVTDAPPAQSEAQPASHGFVQPLAEDEPEFAYYTEQPREPDSLFQRLFSTHIGFAVFTLVTGAFNLFWSMLYFSGLISRTVMFDTAERALLLQGTRSYVIEFSSPILTVLRVLMYLLPVLAVVWALVFRSAENKKHYYNKKTVIVFLCLIVLSMVLTVVDMMALHLIA